MKKKRILCAVVLALVIAAAAACVWYFMPVSFLRGVDSSDVAAISVFNGTNGNAMLLTDREDIAAVVGGVQSVQLKRDRYAPEVDGFVFSLTFTGEDGKEIDSFIINNSDELLDDPFFYVCRDGELCADLLWELESQYCAGQ